MTRKLIKIENPSSGITVVTLQRPEKRNALSIAMMEELIQAIEQHSPSSRALVITGEGSVFSAGLDLQERGDPKLEPVLTGRIKALFQVILNAPCVTIAAVQGDMLAGGAGIALSCDYVVMAMSGVVTFPEVKKGIVPELVAKLLQKQVSSRHVRELLIFGHSISAKRAYEIGIVNQLVEAGRVLPAACEVAAGVVASDEAAIRRLKELLK